MIEQDIQIRMADGVADAVLYRPDRAGVWPGVLHLTDIIGIRPSHRSMARRLAEQGYVVVMPNVFFRTGRAPLFDSMPNMGDERTMKRFGELKSPLTPEVMERDASTYVDFLGGDSGVRPGPMGVVGYCFAGSMALRTAAARPDRIAAMASFHGGGLYTDSPASPHRLLPRVKAQLYFGHAVNDKGMPAEAIAGFERELSNWGGNFASESYEGSLHGWTVPDHPVYNHPQAERAFGKLMELFAATLGARAPVAPTDRRAHDGGAFFNQP